LPFSKGNARSPALLRVQEMVFTILSKFSLSRAEPMRDSFLSSWIRSGPREAYTNLVSFLNRGCFWFETCISIPLCSGSSSCGTLSNSSRGSGILCESPLKRFPFRIQNLKRLAVCQHRRTGFDNLKEGQSDPICLVERRNTTISDRHGCN
jgi:hypothetical protein